MADQSHQPSPADVAVIEIFRQRDGLATLATLADGSLFTVRNIGWGYDIGDPWAHVFTNVSPTVDGASFDFFFTDEISLLADPTGGVLYENPSASRRGS
jgi:hypothetical protein